MIEPLLVVDGISKSFSTRRGTISVIDEISLQVGTGEFVSVIGPSGSGKSTLFNILAEQLRPTSGSVRFLGSRQPKTPFSAYMPQKDLLMPWLTVEDNAALGLVLGGTRKREARDRVRQLLSTFRLEGREKAYPFELSGGMRQRVALMRTVVQQRPLLLLDEPFGALDYLTRTELQFWLSELSVEQGLTVVLITHDVPEALFLSDRVYVLSDRPARVQMVLEQPAPRPRDLSYLETEAFTHDERLLLAELTHGGLRQKATQ
ncbi:ABC transporter ATP-binding protein [Subtercola frigoramans]|uniref:ABC-type nitrate/sulfonate/bicarbonate transport system ATPase subunit n=1 Tax=Subtercola frigoramans TaxID=120298 RepID=A0ABS2L130_9MICO|nr:ABC transporter ATP-binding protein [Subtercola frigoramans]MBM7470790.1 ABC-type nitrate/sulfonate/bicarbonate transport system ATPase subunit [Subtercola frigoramans]